MTSSLFRSLSHTPHTHTCMTYMYACMHTYITYIHTLLERICGTLRLGAVCARMSKLYGSIPQISVNSPWLDVVNNYKIERMAALSSTSIFPASWSYSLRYLGLRLYTIRWDLMQYAWVRTTTTITRTWCVAPGATQIFSPDKNAAKNICVAARRVSPRSITNDSRVTVGPVTGRSQHRQIAVLCGARTVPLS